MTADGRGSRRRVGLVIVAAAGAVTTWALSHDWRIAGARAALAAAAGPAARLFRRQRGRGGATPPRP